VGDENGTTVAHLTAAIGPHTAGMLYFSRGDLTPGVLPLHDVIEVAHRHGIPVIVDAASEIYPVERMTRLPASGADLICFGAKYLGAQNSAGILCGRADLVAAAKLNGFIGYEQQRSRSLGRGYKLDRQEVIGVTVALQEWLTMDHEERLQSQADRIETIRRALADLPQISAETVWDAQRDPWMRLSIQVDPAKAGQTAANVVQRLRNGEPSIWLRNEGDQINVMVHTLHAAEVALVASRLRAVFTT
jgi:D-glucosaminate-6-phosphate ammonia-lyase